MAKEIAARGSPVTQQVAAIPLGGVEFAAAGLGAQRKLKITARPAKGEPLSRAGGVTPRRYGTQVTRVLPTTATTTGLPGLLFLRFIDA